MTFVTLRHYLLGLQNPVEQLEFGTGMVKSQGLLEQRIVLSKIGSIRKKLTWSLQIPIKHDQFLKI